MKVQTAIVILVAILYFLSFFVKYSDVQTRRDASGFEHHYAARFFYFYYYTGHFPLATLDTNLTYSKEAAKSQIAQHGEQLIMEYQHWSRLGEHGRIWCYLPDAWLKGSAAQPTIRLFNALFFLLGLLSLYRAFYLLRKPAMGLIFCAAIICTPYFHFEVFRQTNIFALQSSVFFISAGLLLPFLSGQMKFTFKSMVLVLAASATVAFCSEIRNEISIVMACIGFILVLATDTQWKHKFILIALALFVFAGGKKLIHVYFDHKYQETKELVSAQGGHVYNGKKISGHKFWHPVFCGLGDYDRKYGYAWNDTVAYQYAMPILNGQYAMNLSYSGKLHTDNYYDSAHLYYIKFDEIPEYESIVKEKVLHTILSDPLWYMQIIFHRIIKICSTTLPFPFLGFVAVALSGLIIRRRQWFYLKLMLISLPLTATSLLIYSGGGSTYNSLFGYMTVVIILYEILSGWKIKKTPR
jgi:hypothetical protein